MKMIKYMKESILGFLLTCKLMYIINQQYINHLVEMEKVIFVIVANRIDKLSLELIGIDVKYCFIRKQSLYLNPDSLCQMRFSQTASSVYQQWIKCSPSRIIGYGITGRSCKSVTLSFNKIIKRILGVQPRVNIQLFYPGDDKRVFNRLLGCIQRDSNRLVLDLFTVLGRKLHRVGLVIVIRVVLHNNIVFQLSLRT